MPNLVKLSFLENLKEKVGGIKKLSNSFSLYEVGNGAARIYIRYSKIHSRKQAFYGIRKEDLKELDGFNSFICFLFDNQEEPVFLPYEEFAEILISLTPSSDGQIKSSIFIHDDTTELYISNSGRFNIEGYVGWRYLLDRLDEGKLETVPDFNHSQIQTIIGAIGKIKGNDIWIPSIDRNKLDWNVAKSFDCINQLPDRYEKINGVIREIDIIWLKRGSSRIEALFEVEHSTPIYPGLLRFNDLHISEPNLKPKYSIISNSLKRALFFRQISRPTFLVSGLSEFCNFLNYRDVFSWYNRVSKEVV